MYLILQQLTRSQAANGMPAQASKASSGDGSEGKLRGEVQLLKEHLKSAYEKAAEATSHVAQYQALAESSNQALEAMQVSCHFLQCAQQDRTLEHNLCCCQMACCFLLAGYEIVAHHLFGKSHLKISILECSAEKS